MDKKEKYELTEVQLAYVIGRSDNMYLGGNSTHFYFEVNMTADISRFETALNKVIEKQSMLRTVVYDDGTQNEYQGNTYFTVETVDVCGNEAFSECPQLLSHREKASQRVFPLNTWPMFEIKAFSYGNDKYVLALDFDMIIMDRFSIDIFLTELYNFYSNPDNENVGLNHTFRDYISDKKEYKKLNYDSDKVFWNNIITSLPPAPQIPHKEDIPSGSRFSSKEFIISAEKWNSIKEILHSRRITSSVFVLVCYAKMLSMWSNQSSLTINMTAGKRKVGRKIYNDVIGDFTELLLIDFDFMNDADGKAYSMLEMCETTQSRIRKYMKHDSFTAIEAMKEYAKLNNGTADFYFAFTSRITDNTSEVYSELFSGRGYQISQTPQLLIDCQVSEQDGELYLRWDYIEMAFDENFLEDMYKTFAEYVLQGIESDSRVLSELEKTIEKYNSTKQDIPSCTLQELFRHQAERTPDKTAVYADGKSLRYKELDEKAIVVASYIIKNFGIGKRICVLAERNVMTIVNIVGILKAGCTYIPVDSSYPEERKNSIIKQSSAVALLGTDFYESIKGNVTILPEAVRDIGNSNDEAYIIYTSGSTGEPKGVVITHDAVCNTVQDINKRFSITEKDCIIGISSFCFDLSVYDIFGALSTGAELVIAKDVFDTENIKNLMKEFNVTFWNTVPSIMEMLINSIESGEKFLPLRNVFLSGDWIPLRLPDEIKKHFPNASVTSFGGATEGSIWSIYYPVEKNNYSWKSIPYGYPLANQQMYVLNYDGKPTPFGAVGEICIGGRGVAKCYQGMEKLTAEKYTLHEKYGRIYHTGDFGIFHRNGCIEFMGRKDSQFKIRGFRVELGEIESSLMKCENVIEAVADVFVNSAGTQYLLGYVVLNDENAEFDEDSIKKTIGNHLPKYMIPSHIYELKNIPLTSNGKVNRKALPKKIENITAEYIAPSTETEKLIVSLVEDISGCEKVGINESLFDLGIDSIKAIRMVSKIKESGYSISLTELYKYDDIRSMAEYLDIMKPAVENHEKAFEIVPLDKWKPFRLTPLQESYFIGRVNSRNNSSVFTGGYIELDCNEYNHDKMQFCIRKIIAKHDILRCSINDDGTQQFLETVDVYNIELDDLTSLSESEKQKALSVSRKQVSETKTDLKKPPLIFIKSSLIGKEHAIMHIYLDGLILDGWGTELFISELASLYINGKYMYDCVDVTFRDYVRYLEYQRTTEQFQTDKDYWKSRISDMPESASLPLLKSPDEITDAVSGQIPCSISIEDWDKLGMIAKKYRVTTFSVLFTAFAYVMSRWNNKKRFLLNIPAFDVPDFHKDYFKVMGVCSSFLIVTIEIDRNKSFLENVKKIQSHILELKEHSTYSGMDVVHDIYRMNGRNDTESLVPFVFGMVMETGKNDSNIPEDKQKLIKLIYQENRTAKILIDINTIKYENHIEFNWNYLEGVLDRKMLSEMASAQIDIITKAVNSENFWNTSLNISLPERDRKVIEQANNTESNFDFVSMPVVIEKSIKEYSDKPYLNTIDKSYTYSEIGILCRRFASMLLEKGCRAGDYIAVHMEKSAEQIVAILSIAMMGGVYVPVEYSYPFRLAEKCFRNTDCKLMIVSREKSSDFEKSGIDIIVSDLNALPTDNGFKVSTTDEESLIAIIYTSGSTGEPKPVMVGQKGLLNSLIFTNRKFGVSANDSAIALTNTAHDMSMYDIFGMLMAGASLTLPYEKDAKNPQVWIELIRKYGVTIWNSVPTMQEMLRSVIRDEQLKDISTLRLIIHGGDYLKPALAQWIHDSIKNVVLVNVGGPTETTLWNIFHIVSEEDINSRNIPYGKPISNTKYYVLNENLEKLPIGVSGMMYCAGVGVTKGYYNNPALTSEKYIILPETNERVYRTGDMGKYCEDGTLMFMGREDNQVKINGKRIELKGIASVIMEFEEVNECEVFVINGNEITAYYTADKKIQADILRNHTASLLPSYMIPKHFVFADRIICKPNGKVDKQAMISAYDVGTDNVNVENIENLDEIEQKILDIYRRELNIEIDADTDIYMAGGNSIMILNMIPLIKEMFSIEMELSEIFSFTTVREIADYIKESMVDNQ